MKLKKLLPKRSKQGVTLVEAVVAVVVLAMFATGVLTLLTTGRTKIAETAAKSNAHAEATKMLDLVIAAISNGGYLVLSGAEGSQVVPTNPEDNSLNKDALISDLGLDIAKSDLDVTKLDCYVAVPPGTSITAPTNIRGWYLELSYKGATVTGYASNTQGVFDR